MTTSKKTDAQQKKQACQEQIDELSVMRSLVKHLMKLPKGAVSKLRKLPLQSRIRIAQALSQVVLGVSPAAATEPEAQPAPVPPIDLPPPLPGVKVYPSPAREYPRTIPQIPPDRPQVVVYGCPGMMGGPIGGPCAYMAPTDSGWGYTTATTIFDDPAIAVDLCGDLGIFGGQSK